MGMAKPKKGMKPNKKRVVKKKEPQICKYC